MTPMFPVLVIAYDAEAVISPYRILKFGAADGGVVQSSVGTDMHIGVAGKVGADASGDRLDVYRAGVVPVEYGDDVAAGNLLTADADGKAVVAVAGDRVLGIAEEAGDSGTIGSMLIAVAQCGAFDASAIAVAADTGIVGDDVQEVLADLASRVVALETP